MSEQHFSFPPPPPPPPPVSQFQQGYSQPPQGRYGYTGNNNRGGRGSRENFRDRNRGSSRIGHSGYPRSNNYSARQDASYNSHGPGPAYGNYPLPNYPPVQQPQYPANLRQDYGQSLPVSSDPSSLAITQAPPSEYPSYQPQSHNAYSSYPHQAYGQANPYGQPSPSGYQNANLERYASASQPASMGPPIHLGSEGQRHNQHSQYLPQPTATGTISFQNTHSNVPITQHPGIHDSASHFHAHRGRGSKRGHGEAFGKPRSQNPRPRAAPAVPSFGGALPLPIKPPPSKEQTRRPRKKKRKHNQLGLTPKTEDHESSEEEEDDMDEESKLATISGLGVGPQLLQFEYKGRTSTLQTPSDITAWVEERRKRFPTQARATEAAERKRQEDELRRAEHQARKEALDKKRAAVKESQRQKLETEKKRREPKEGYEDAAAKAKHKVEKLRKQLEKQEKRAAKALAKASHDKPNIKSESVPGDVLTQSSEDKKRKRSDSFELSNRTLDSASNTNAGCPHETNLQGSSQADSDSILPQARPVEGASIHGIDAKNPDDRDHRSPDPMPDPLTPMSQPPMPDETLDKGPSPSDHKPSPDNGALESGIVKKEIEGVDIKPKPMNQDPTMSATSSSTEVSSTDSEDLTSSSGSSSSDSESGNDVPDQVSSRRVRPERVPPPKRERRKAICNAYLKTGHCKYGYKCRYMHELPERGRQYSKHKGNVKAQGRTPRISLHQRLVDKEKENEAEAVVKASVHFGDRGLLEPDAVKREKTE